MSIKNVLLLVEGAKTDVKLIKKLFEIYDISWEYKIIPYKTNIYTLYKNVFEQNDAEYIDLIQTLKENSNSDFDWKQRFSDIFLVFDFEPQDDLFSTEKIIEMSEYFDESTGNGKLYLNYPMVESAYHTKVIDKEFNERKIKLIDVTGYKSIVNNMNPDPRKLLATKEDTTELILKHIKKANIILGKQEPEYNVDLINVLNKQLELFTKGEIYVLATCLFIIADYSSDLIKGL